MQLSLLGSVDIAKLLDTYSCDFYTQCGCNKEIFRWSRVCFLCWQGNRPHARTFIHAVTKCHMADVAIKWRLVNQHGISNFKNER